MKLQLVKGIKAEVNRLNKLYGDETSPSFEMWQKMNKRENLIIDAMLYVDDAYVSNKFKSLDNWCLRTGKGEVPSDYRMRVKKKIGEMLIEDIITIVD
jgi:hypothetical protein